MAAVMFAQFMDLGMAVMAAGNAVARLGGLDLVVLDFAEFQAFILVSRLEKAAAAPAAEVVGVVGGHVNDVFLSNTGFDNIAQIIGNGITVAFANDLAGILYGEFDLQVLVPVGIDLELALANPFGIVFVDVFDFKLVLDVELLQSGPDCECDVASFGIEKRFAPQFMGLVRGGLDDVLPCVIIGQKHAVVFPAPAL